MEAYNQYSGGQRARKYVDKDGIYEERIYLGSFELYRKFDNAGSLTVERQTVHISDDPPTALGTSTRRIAMLEKRTYGTDESEEELVRYIYSNHLQSSALELDAGGDIISYEKYHPYGTTSYQAMNALIKATAKRYRYTGKERDEESGLYYHGARYYIPWLCRWSASDPLENKYAGMSPYNYGNCNPIVFNDPSGMGGEDAVKGGWYYSKNGAMEFAEGIDTKDKFETSKYKDEGTWMGVTVGEGRFEYTKQYREDGSILINRDGKETVIPYKGSTKIKKEEDPKAKKNISSTSKVVKSSEVSDVKANNTEVNAKSSESRFGDPKTLEDNIYIFPMSTSPVATYNGILRSRYTKNALNLYSSWNRYNSAAESNLFGMEERFKLKADIRNKTIGGFKKFLDITEGPVERLPVLNDKGKVRRFWFTNPKYNVFSKISKGLGIAGLGLSAIRIARADDPVRESVVVGSGFVTAWATMTVVGPMLAPLFAANPIIGSIVLFTIGAAAGIGGEAVADKILNFFKW